MKMRTYIAAFILGLIVLNGCTNDEHVAPGVDTDALAIGADGGSLKLNVGFSDDWIATTDNPWIIVSPANGRGAVECRLQIDSALTDQPRRGFVRFQNQRTWENRDVVIDQAGYGYTIALDDDEVSVANYAAYGKRSFDVEISTNIDFDVKIPDNAGWLKVEKYQVELNRGARPRRVQVRFNWDINSRPEARIADVVFQPRKDVELDKQDKLTVTQQAAEPIVENTPAGDSVALLAIARSLNTWYSWESSEPMKNWDNVVIWEKGMSGYQEGYEGRVKSAYFKFFTCKEGLPFEVQYLTAAEELSFSSNANTFLLDLTPGEHIAKLTQLRRLSIVAYGLTELPESFAALGNLEFLDLTGNNFQRVPAILTPENFPKLHALNLTANQRNSIYDLSNTVRTGYGGLRDEGGFPQRLLEWEKLDTLALSVNYLQGELPGMEHWAKYSQADIDAVDSLPQALVGIPKVLPNMRYFCINLNRLTGEIPEWLLYHPALDWWVPSILVFTQEGKDETGRSAGFSNEPVNMNYYYEFYKGCGKKLEPTETAE